jgi:Spy/CpxP family protein refolding chaperone
MAKVTITAVATALAANAANVATQASLTTANITAIAALLALVGERRGNAHSLIKLLSDTNRAQLYLND